MILLTKDSQPNHVLLQSVLRESMNRGVRIIPHISIVLKEYEDLLEEKEKLLAKKGIRYQDKRSYTAYFEKNLSEVESNALGVVQEYDTTIIKKLASMNNDIAQAIVECNTLSRGFIKSINGICSCIDTKGLIYPQISIAKTNRITYRQPALLNIPKLLLPKIVTPRNPENMLYSVDVKQQEPMILINLLNITSVKKLIQETDDVYSAIYMAVFNQPCGDGISRQEMKSIWNALSYGASKKKLQTLSTTFDANIVWDYFNSIKEYKQYKEGIKKAKKVGDSRSIKTYFGTLLNGRGEKYTTMLNMPIQGTAADILALLVEYSGMLDHELFKLYYTRHDELILEVSTALKGQNIDGYLKEQFTHKVEDWIPFQVDVKQIY